MDLLDCIQLEVDKLKNVKYKDDKCPPEFIVSLFYESENSKQDRDHRILMTVIHNGYNFSKVIFPELSSVYGYQSLEQTMEYMYNKTM